MITKCTCPVCGKSYSQEVPDEVIDKAVEAAIGRRSKKAKPALE